jgi:hypothetical protein
MWIGEGDMSFPKSLFEESKVIDLVGGFEMVAAGAAGYFECGVRPWIPEPEEAIAQGFLL